MAKSILTVSLYLAALLLANTASACFYHYGGGFAGGNMPGAAALAMPEKRFKVNHPSTTIAVIGEEAELSIEYDRSDVSENVRIQVSGTANVEVLDQDIELMALTGEVKARFRLTGKGYDMITITISGDHEGENLSYSSRVFVRAKPVASKQTADISAG